MTLSPSSLAAAELLYAEALCLDQKRWQDWLDLYEPDAVYWVPSWRKEHELIEDPEAEISFTYLDSKRQLEERVHRIQSGKTPTAQPLPRTLHCVGNVVLKGVSSGPDGMQRWEVGAAWTTHLYDPRKLQQHQLFGHYEHTLVVREGSLRIARKKVVLMNDRVPTVLDIYSI
jgi:3-phenylpropionate/cinnamic acid dioxygenase small subunit